MITKLSQSKHPGWAVAGLLFFTFAGAAQADNKYLVHNLVSDLPGVADHVDAHLVNPWGISFSGTSPFWISNNHSATSTLYDTSGAAIPLVVNIPTSKDSTGGAPTGQFFNSTTGFAVAAGKPALFVFCSEDGIISGWNSSVDGTHAKVLVDNSSSDTSYKGCALGGTTAAPLLFAADFHNSKIDVIGGDLKPVTPAGGFADPAIPPGYGPFNIANLGGKLYVTYARQDGQKEDDSPGAGAGFVSVFDMTGTLLKHLISNGALNSPWGLAIAPASFGDFAGALLVGNFGDGKINAYNATDGTWLASLNDVNGNPIAIRGLWALVFGNGGRGGDPSTLYFTAGIPGPNGESLESHGLFGSIQPSPNFTATHVLNGASFTTTVAPNGFASIKGGALSAVTRQWQTADFVNGKLPTTLDGVSVTVNGEPAYISFISPMQINFLIPTDVAPGPADFQVTSNGLTSAKVSATVAPVAPSFFQFSGTKYLAATHGDNSLLGAPKLIANATTTPAVGGETIVLYGNGFGATSPAAPNGTPVNGALQLVTVPTITIGGTQADVKFAGLTATGLYQFNVVVPSGLPAGDAAVVASVPGAQSQDNAFITIAAQ